MFDFHTFDSCNYRGNHSDVVKVLLDQNLSLEKLNCEILVKSSLQDNTSDEDLTDMIIKVPVPQSKGHDSWIISRTQDELRISSS